MCLISELVNVLAVNMKLCSIVLCTVLVGCLVCDGARILGVFPVPAPSQNILAMRLMKELATRGHEVTMVSPFQQTETDNYSAILLTDLKNSEEMRKDVTQMAKKNPFGILPYLTRMFATYTRGALNNANFQKLLQSNATFDLIITPAILTETLVGVGYHFSAPVIVLSTVGQSLMGYNYVGIPTPGSTVPDIFLSFTGTMSYPQRLINTVVVWVHDLYHQFYHLRVHNELLHEYFPGAPELQDVLRKYVALVLLNSDPSFDMAKPLVPNMIHIGGYHVEEPRELPQDLKSYLDNATTGFVLFSLGSNMQSTMIPVEIRRAILQVFSKLPFKVLWKFEDEELPGKPDNVKICKWLPQNDILAHRNIKLFITHGGLLSIMEAIYHGVPMVGIPVFGDQKSNIARAEYIGLGRSVAFHAVTGETLTEAIKEVVNNNVYSTNARERSRLMRDLPQRPIDTAMFWVEYVLRNKNSSHLKNPAIYLEWHQIRMLDIYATLAGGVILVSAVFYILVKKICCSKQAVNKYSQELQKKKIN